jgi:glycosyltransferase involved in cell wall biosynthesis
VRIKYVSMAVQQDHGYGVVGYLLHDALLSAGAELVPRTEGNWALKILVGTLDSWFLDHFQPDLVFHTMWEADPLPANWLPWINNAGAVWVPSQWVADVFRRGGVTRPIIVSGYAVDQKDYAYVERERDEDEPYTFMCWARWDCDRKRTYDVVKAFCKAALPNARLVVKHNAGVLGRDCERSNNPLAQRFENVRVVDWNGTYNGVRIHNVLRFVGSMPRYDLGRLFYHCDVLVYPSANEGFGLMPMEFAATGGTVIAPAYSGLAEYITDDIALVLPVTEVIDDPYMSRVWGTGCKTARVSIDDMAERMVWCYEHRGEAARLGQHAAEVIAERWTWEAAGRRALAALEAYQAGREQ